MTNNDEDMLYIIHIVEAIERIEQYTTDGRNNFEHDRKTYDAVLRNLQTMAESTQKLSLTVIEKYGNIEWDKISAFRNVLVHDYLGDLNYNLLWEVIVHKLPDLKKAMQKEQTVIEK